MKYCAFLRGINVNGIRLKMTDICEIFEDAGMQKVSSVLNTGNILFTFDKNEVELKQILEEKLSHHFKYKAFLFLKNEEEIFQILTENPFEKEENLHIYIFITETGTGSVLAENFQNAQKGEDEKGLLIGDTFYWQVKKGNTLESDFGKILGKATLKQKITSRNLNTLEKVKMKIEKI